MIWRRGESLVDRMDFEELALKGIDPTLGPSLSHPDLPGNNAKKQRKEEESQIKGTKRLAVSSSRSSILLLRGPRLR